MFVTLGRYEGCARKVGTTKGTLKNKLIYRVLFLCFSLMLFDSEDCGILFSLLNNKYSESWDVHFFFYSSAPVWNMRNGERDRELYILQICQRHVSMTAIFFNPEFNVSLINSYHTSLPIFPHLINSYLGRIWKFSAFQNIYIRMKTF